MPKNEKMFWFRNAVKEASASAKGMLPFCIRERAEFFERSVS